MFANFSVRRGHAAQHASAARLDIHNLMLRVRPGVFVAGEMLDSEAPTGGHLLTACCASGLIAGRGAVAWLGTPPAQQR